jgi:ABC-type transport system involved in multi-copper enzyme maturation permease subunit
LKEVRDFLRSWAFWGMMLILCLLVGYSFIQAVALYAEASRSAPPGSDLAANLSPLDGILVPTFGAYYLALTLLFPFVAIRALGGEKQSGSVKLLLQLPIDPARAVAIKASAMMAAWLLALSPGLSAVAAWAFIGGHVPWLETFNLLLGYGLYALAIVGISLFASSLTDSAPTAALAALAIILSSWVLDFSGGAGPGLLARLAPISLTAALRPFERGLFLTAGALRLAVVALGSMALASVLLEYGDRRRRLRAAALVIVASAIAGVLCAGIRFSKDISEDRRNSFNPGVERALNGLDKPLRVTAHLSPEDSRLQDMQRNILDKLRRAVPRLTISLDAGRDYGWITYDYEGRADRSTSNSEEEILPIIFKLADRTVAQEHVQDYRGYPLARDAGRSWIWFYLILPALLAGGAFLSRRTKAFEIIAGGADA